MSHHRRLRGRIASRSQRLAAETLEGRALLSATAHIVTIPATATLAAPASTHGQTARQQHLAAIVAAHRHHGPLATLNRTSQVVAAPATGGITPLVTPGSVPYTPAQVSQAYGFNTLSQDGTGQTIAIVDAYDDPTIASDLAAFDSAFGLPAPPSFVKAVPSSGTPAKDAGWDGEIALDVEWAHAMAPKANILLVETASSSLTDLFAGVDYAVAQGAKQVSMSWGGGQFRSETSYDSHFDHPGVTFLVASGDNGKAADYPASSPYITAVGGTTLKIDSNGNRISETAWSGSGGGTSSYEARPTNQNGFTSAKNRSVPDVAYNADPNTGYYTYDSSSGTGTW